MDYKDFLFLTGKVITLDNGEGEEQGTEASRRKSSMKKTNKKKKKQSKKKKTKKSTKHEADHDDIGEHDAAKQDTNDASHPATYTPSSVKSKRKFSFSDFLSPTTLVTPKADDATCSTQSLSWCDESSSMSFSCDDLSSVHHPHHGSGGSSSLMMSGNSSALFSPFHHSQYNLTPRTPKAKPVIATTTIGGSIATPTDAMMKDKKKKKSYLKRHQGRDKDTSKCRKSFLKDRLSSIIDKEDAFAMLMVHEFQEMEW